tara:strand:+ start:376 stop:954 length:579 start_codon:yes stop_codon:yes gene_type:complete
VKRSLFNSSLSITLALAYTTSFSSEINEEFIRQELLRIQNSPDHSVSFEIDAPREFIFQFLTHRVQDYVNNAEAITFSHVNSISEDRLGAGSIRITTMENGEELVQRFLSYDPPSTYAYFTDMEASSVNVPLSYSLAHYELTYITSEKTNLRVSVVYRSSSRLLSFFVKRAFNSALEDDFAAAAKLIEERYR